MMWRPPHAACFAPPRDPEGCRRSGLLASRQDLLSVIRPDLDAKQEPAELRAVMRPRQSFERKREMTRNVLKFAAVATLLMAAGSAYADDPTGVLLQERGLMPRQGHAARFSDLGPCGRGTQSVPFPNGQGYRCVRR